MKTYKVIVWGLGNVGRSAIRMIGEKKSLQLVAAVDVDPKKIGRDAGEIFGFPAVGVKVTADLDAALKLDADVVLDYTPTAMDKEGTFMPSAKMICKVLDAGKNVITTIPVYHCEKSQPEVYKMINEHAKAAHVTFTPFGLLPGDYASYIPLVIAGTMGRVDKIIVQSGEDDWHNTSGWVSVFGYGSDLASYPEANGPKDLLGQFISAYYSSGAYEMADRLGVPYDEYKFNHEIFLAPRDISTIQGPVKAGTIYGHRFTMSLYVKGEEKVSLRYVHKVGHKTAPELPIANTIHIEGLPGVVDAEINGLIPDREGYVTSAAPTVNLIPQVAEGPEGYTEACDLPVAIPVL